MSQRHVLIDGLDRPELDAGDRALLDAARASVMAVGVRRTTLTDVARRAGVSRMTVYRRFPDVTALLQALMTREFGALLRETAARPSQHPTVRERFAAALADGVTALSEHPLLQRILDIDPELMLPYAFHRYGAFQHATLTTFAAQLREGMADGSIRQTDPETLAASLELMLRGVALAARTEEVTANRAALRDEIEATIERGLRP